MQHTPFSIEHERDRISRLGRLKSLKQTYTKDYPEIKDLNSRRFWNEKLGYRSSLDEQDGMTQKRAKIVASFLPNTVNSVLDIGVGPGWVEELLEKRKSLKIFGTDISDMAIKILTKRFNGVFWVESIYDKHKKNNKYDAILTLEVMEHIPPSKTFSVFKKIYSLLNSKGYYILSVPTNEGLEKMQDNPNGHVRLYTVPLICAELKIAGFKVIRVKTIYAFKDYYFLKQIIATIFPKRWEPNNIIILAQKI